MKSVQHERLQRALPFGLLKKKKNSLGFPFLFFNGAFTRMLDSETSVSVSRLFFLPLLLFFMLYNNKILLKNSKTIFHGTRTSIGNSIYWIVL